VHRLLVEEQEDGAAYVASGGATASTRATAAGTSVSAAGAAVRSATSAATVVPLGEVLRRVVEVLGVGCTEGIRCTDGPGSAEGSAGGGGGVLVERGAGRVPVTVLHGVHDRSFNVDDGNDISKLS
jgi:hypothetical protein